MKICLIRPPCFVTVTSFAAGAVPPQAIAYLAGTLSSHGHDVVVIDAIGEAIDDYAPVKEYNNVFRQGLKDKEIIEKIPDDIDLIGVSCLFSVEWPFHRKLINSIKKRFSSVPIISGGEHITALTEYSFSSCEGLDFAIKGEGEDALLDFVTKLETDKKFHEIDSLCYRDGSEIKINGRLGRIRDLEGISRPAWDLINLNPYLNAKNKGLGIDHGITMPILASRGCPYRCTFCSSPFMWTTLWEARKPQDVLDEIITYINQYNASNFDFYDLTAIVKRDWIVDFCSLVINSDYDFTWQLPSGTRSEVIDKEVSALLYKSGCRNLNYAPESGSDRVLKMIKKKIKKTRMLKSMRWSVKQGLNIKANFILGLPSETFFDIIKTYIFIFKTAIIGIQDVSVFPFSAYPGSELFKMLNEKGRIKLNDKYFLSLLGFLDPLDPNSTKSFNESFSSKQLQFLCMIGFAIFYSTQFVIRPWRFAKFVYEVIVKKPKSKFSQAMVRILDKKKEIAIAKQMGLDNA